jgi:3-phenylpropionate/trans-cinnamate dioxygenase ferredoxin component
VAKREIGAVTDIPLGTLKRVLIEGMPICIVRAPDGSLYAIDDRCTHEGDPLSEGEIWGMEVECPTHLSRFDFRTGAVTGPPATTPVQTYSVTVQNGNVYVEAPALRGTV